MSTFNVLIIGAGPAGLATALALTSSPPPLNRSIKITIKERMTVKDRQARQGFGYLVMPNGVEQLETLRASSILDNCVPLRTSILADSQGQTSTIEVDSCYCCARSTIVSGLEERLSTSDNVTIDFGVHVDVDGDTDTDYDLVIAANGVNSSQSAKLNPNNLPAHNAIQTRVTVFQSPSLARKLSGKFTKTMFKSSLAIGLFAPNSHDVVAFAQYDTNVHGVDPDLGEICNLNNKTSVIVPPELLDFFNEGGSFNHPSNSHLWKQVEVPDPRCRRYHDGKALVLVGDACHPLVDFTSQGVSSALEDAVVLAQCMTDFEYDDVGSALVQYEEIRKERRIKYVEAGICLMQNFKRGGLMRPFTRRGSAPAEAEAEAEVDSETESEATSSVTITEIQPLSPNSGEILRKQHLLYSENCKISLNKTSRRESVVRFCEEAPEERHIEQASTEEDLNPFQDHFVDRKMLRAKAFNYRWASLPEGCIPLTAASSDFKVAEPIQKALVKYAEEGYCCYGPPEGLPEFRASLAKYFSKKLSESHEWDCSLEGEGGLMRVDSSMVMATNAAAAGVFHVAESILTEEGDECLVMAPVDFLLRSAVNALKNRKIINYSVASEGEEKLPTFSIGELEELVTPRTKLLSVCNPHNPLGRAWTVNELTDLADFAERHNLMIFSDEVWGDLVFEPKVHICMSSVCKSAAARTYTVLGFSKNYGLEGARIGGLIAPSKAKLDEVVINSGSATTASGASTLSQICACAAMEECGDWLELWRQHLRRNVVYAVERLRGMAGVDVKHMPEACFVIYANINKVIIGEKGSEKDLCQFLERKYSVSVIPGVVEFFGPGSYGHIRIAVGTSLEILREGLDRLEMGCRAYKNEKG